MTKRGDEVPRPNPWTVRAADRRAGKGWDELKAQNLRAADEAWVAITAEPRKRGESQYQLKGSLAEATVGGRRLEQWQYKPTHAGRIWYAIDDQSRTIFLTEVTTGHPKATE